MKKIISIALVAMVSIFSAAGQNNRKQIYTEYCGTPGVNAVYISPSMFKLIKKVPDVTIKDKEVNFSSFIRTLEGMYILNVMDPEIASRLSRDVEKELKYGKHELLMEAVEGTCTTRIYIVGNNDIISDLVLLSKSPESTSYISISGQMPFEEVSKIIN